MRLPSSSRMETESRPRPNELIALWLCGPTPRENHCFPWRMVCVCVFYSVVSGVGFWIVCFFLFAFFERIKLLLIRENMNDKIVHYSKQDKIFKNTSINWATYRFISFNIFNKSKLFKYSNHKHIQFPKQNEQKKLSECKLVEFIKSSDMI